MNTNGVIPGRVNGRVALRVRGEEPYSSELTAIQIGVIADIAERYGSGSVHVTPRQTVVIPHISVADLAEVSVALAANGLTAESSGRRARNVTACSSWCLYNVEPMREAARELNLRLKDRALPGKTNISLSGCDFSCVRSRTSDIGIIARSAIALTQVECKHCSLCVREPLGCQAGAITLTEEGVLIDWQKCVRCGFCAAICRPGTIRMESKAFDVFVGGCGGLKPREAVLYRTVPTLGEAMELTGFILERYAARAREGERLGGLMERAAMGWLED